MDKVFIRQPYNYDAQAVSVETAISVSGESLTQQQFVEESDINTIVNRFLRTGEMPQFDPRAMFGDFVDMPSSYQEALERVRSAQEAFSELPSAVRSRFNGDPAELLNFLSDPRNRDEAIKLGLIELQPAEPAQTTTPAQPVEPGTVGPT